MWGLEPLGLLLWWGDLTAARAGLVKVQHAHKLLFLQQLGEFQYTPNHLPAAHDTLFGNDSEDEQEEFS